MKYFMAAFVTGLLILFTSIQGFSEDAYTGYVDRYGNITLNRQYQQQNELNSYLDALRKWEEIRDMRQRREIRSSREHERQEKEMRKRRQESMKEAEKTKLLYAIDHELTESHSYYAPAVQTANDNFIVYFKGGKQLVCDRAWKDGDTIFLVVQGKNLAIGYSQSEIDMGKSFP